MMAPFYQMGYFEFDFSLVIALIVGVGFGFFLERGGLGDAKKLTAQFYLNDLSVFKILFTAIITAMIGLFWLTKIGFLDDSMIYINPTYILPQLIAGLLFGAGFVTAGLCPGTSCVAIANGKMDGIAVLGGIIFGIAVFAEVFDGIREFVYSTSMGQITLPELFGISHGLVILIVVSLAILGFQGAEYIEKRKRDNIDIKDKKVGFELTFNRKMALIALIPALIAAFVGNPAKSEAELKISLPNNVPQGIDLNFIEAGELAEWIMDRDENLVVIDLRDEEEFNNYHIPFAKNSINEREILQEIEKKSHVVLYADNWTISEDDWSTINRQAQVVYVLNGGLDSWSKIVLFPNLRNNIGLSQNEIERAARVSKYFGGDPIVPFKSGNKHTRIYLREGC